MRERERERGGLEKEKVLDFKESELCDSNRSRVLSDGYLATRGLRMMTTSSLCVIGLVPPPMDLYNKPAKKNIFPASEKIAPGRKSSLFFDKKQL